MTDLEGYLATNQENVETILQPENESEKVITVRVLNNDQHTLEFVIRTFYRGDFGMSFICTKEEIIELVDKLINFFAKHDDIESVEISNDKEHP